ncbi:hypothetical protein [Phycisphaera mikurensis]|uniref:Uncharacterized protein n=1 Tax=Phycisphaera mikurensis (strain NBRC 102666 / KCTC 22515 / FYK2301M01) TaxID=1142394 RepID=I0IAX1_PHYMF|nr:hypothetical protein [Phycisphaera mikurensis]MBB6442617.1 hypothetical protein [Phycisphaera mikurensis]BAM02409.1 hypothetical protein PSMK_02500 [Phycisphaera mikurensis NBRC 102666]
MKPVPAVLAAALALGSLSLPGCEAVAVPFLLLRSHKVEAVARLPPGSVAVLAEAAPGLPAGDPRVRSFTDQVAATAGQHLATNLRPLQRRADGSPKKGQAVVDGRRVARERERDAAAFAALPLDALPARLGVDTLVFVEVQALRLPNAADAGMTGALVVPAASGTVRVVDARGVQLFPRREDADAGGFLGGPAGRPFSVDLRARRIGEDAADPANVRRDLADAAGLAVARLFYDWTGQAPGDTVYEERRRTTGTPRPGDRL